VKTNGCAYNFGMKRLLTTGLISLLLISALPLNAQDSAAEPLAITTKTLPDASLWNCYGSRGRNGVNLRSSGGSGTHRWRVVGGSLPRGLTLQEFGILTGYPEQAGDFGFTVLVSDGEYEVKRKFVLKVERPFFADWARKSQVNGSRVDGSIKVSNTTGRDFDVTFVVLAVNEIGRATAIGYQRFTLKSNTRDMELPFGDTLAPGSYDVNIDVVAEEPQSRMIFRGRLVAPKQTIAPVL
jgi:hypothetical protein